MDQISKILVHLPDDEIGVIQNIPFISTLKDQYPDAQLNLMMSKDNSSLLMPISTAMDFNIFYINEDDFKGPFSIHRYAYNLNDIFNIDLSFSLNNNWKSAFLAFCFRSRNRLGKYSLRARPFLTQFKKYPKNEGAKDLGFDLLSSFQKKAIERIRVPFPNYQAEDEAFGEVPIINILLTKEEYENPLITDQLKEYFSLAEKVKFKFLLSESSTEEVRPDLEELSSKNTYDFKFDKKFQNLDAICQNISYATGVITTSPIIAYYCDFFETPFTYIGKPLSEASDWKKGNLCFQDGKGVFQFEKLLDLSNK